MDAKGLLDQLLQTGKEMASKGQAAIEEKLDIAEPGEKRDATISGIKTGAMAAGVLALLLGTKTGRNVTGSALKLGSLAAVGGIAWTAYQNWQAKQGDAASNDDVTPINRLEGDAADRRSLNLLRAMIAAAKADGHVDADELVFINEQMSRLGLAGDVARFVQKEVASPLNLDEIAALADNPEAGAEIYLVSSMLIDKEKEVERAYLDALAAALELPDALLVELEKARSEAS